MDFNDIISELKNKYGLLELVPDKNNVYSLSINSHFSIFLTQAVESDTFFLFSNIAALPKNHFSKERLYEKLLSANLFGQETHKCYFAVDPQKDTILLICRLDTSLPHFPAFLDEMQDFINLLSYWETKFKEDDALFSGKKEEGPSAPNFLNFKV